MNDDDRYAASMGESPDDTPPGVIVGYTQLIWGGPKLDGVSRWNPEVESRDATLCATCGYDLNHLAPERYPPIMAAELPDDESVHCGICGEFL